MLNYKKNLKKVLTNDIIYIIIKLEFKKVMVLVMYAVWIERYSMGELDDLYPIVFSTKKQAKNYARKVLYPCKAASVSKVDLEWCSKNKPDCYRIKPRQSTEIVCWEQF